MKLDFEILESNDVLTAKRARVPGGYIYLFEELALANIGDQAHYNYAKAATSCFVPDEPEPNAYGERGVEQIAGALKRAGFRP